MVEMVGGGVEILSQDFLASPNNIAVLGLKKTGLGTLAYPLAILLFRGENVATKHNDSTTTTTQQPRQQRHRRTHCPHS